MPLLVRRLLWSPFIAFFAATLLIAGCSKSSTDAGLEKEDLDGDGIANIYDPDMDGDGIANGSDPDIDGDGKPNGKDPSPGTNTPNYCDQIQVYGLNEKDTTGSEIELTWKLTSSKTGGDCVVNETVASALVMEHASAVGAATTDSEPTNPLLNSRAKIKIPAACAGGGGSVEVTYDFTEIADLIKADPNAPGWTVKQRHKEDPERCDTSAGIGNLDCPISATGTYPNCSCPDGEEYDGATNSCEVVAAACVFVNQSDLKTAVEDYERGGGNGKYQGYDRDLGRVESKFANCGLIGTWDVSQVTNMAGIFMGYDKFDEDISDWDVSKVTGMVNMFHDGEGPAMKFNQDISGWDVSNVKKMQGMFKGARFFNQDLSRWDVSQVQNMELMFAGASAFNQPIGNWNVSQVSDMNSMFYAASSFNHDISGWNVWRAGNMGSMFNGATAFNQDLSGWCVPNVYARGNFAKNSGFQDQPLKHPNWGTCSEPHAIGETTSDTDNDGIPNGSDPDVDGDGIPNTSDKDIDGDGIANKNDPDIDGDGIKNGIDKDSDGDGTPDAEDETPGGPS